ncbi:DUF6705 family protein [Dokdonia sp. Hel_I_53]|uniref:DUF6705 family protein n=1 Tax=Dokdonia sp. Hel_I_53 TaxID=1566287 RepID=UPI00119B8471|nr:DUF6705 family protein [Dokdonia sp. Hel_I_53]TVZ52752.1 hypothetical protein OD90_1936 [Dokdonia sp. Hel_I_53]
MKTIFNGFLFILTLSCTAQTIIPIHNIPNDVPLNNIYYKDVENDLTRIVGQWKWEEEHSSLTIDFEKLERVIDDTGTEYYDFLVGEYRYIENGTVLVDAIPFTADPNDVYRHSIVGGIVNVTVGAPPCDACTTDTRFIRVNLDDPTRPGISGSMVFARYLENGEEKIVARILTTFNKNYLTQDNYTGPELLSIPEGVYTFLKQ